MIQKYLLIKNNNNNNNIFFFIFIHQFPKLGVHHHRHQFHRRFHHPYRVVVDRYYYWVNPKDVLFLLPIRQLCYFDSRYSPQLPVRSLLLLLFLFNFIFINFIIIFM